MKPIKQKTGFFEDTFRAYLRDSPDKIKRSIEFEQGHRNIDPYTMDLMDARQGYMTETIDYITPDPTFNWAEQAEEDGLESFIPHMSQQQIKNRTQYDVVKRHIQEIQTNARRLNASDRFWGPMIASQFMQFETYSLIPFTFGSGVGLSAAIKGAFKLGAANVITEIPREHTRRYYDPYYNETHSVMVFGLSGAIGGVMGALPPIVRGATKAWRSRGIGQASKYDDMPNEKLVKESFEEWDQKYNSGIDLEFDLKIPGVSRNVAYKTTISTGKYIDLKTGKVFNTHGRDKLKRRAGKTDLYIPIKFTKDSTGREVLEIDDAWIEVFWQQFQRGKNVPNIPPTFNKFIKTKGDFRNYLIRKEVYRDLEFVDDLPSNIKERELMFNARVMDDLINENKMSFQTREMVPPIEIGTNHFKIDINPVNMLNRMMEKIVPLTKYNKALQSDPKLYFKSNHLINSLLNDNGMKLKAANKGLNINDSVVTTRDVIWGKHHLEYENTIHNLYLKYVKSYNPTRNKLNAGLRSTYESLQISRERAQKKVVDKIKDARNKLLNQESKNIADDAPYENQLTRGEFNEEITRLMSNVDEFEKATIPELKEAVVARRKYYKKYKNVIESENLMGYKALEENFDKLMKASTRVQKKLDAAPEGSGNKYLYQTIMDDFDKRKDFLREIFNIDKNGVITKKAMPDGDISKTGILPMNETDQTFFHRIFNREAWMNNEELGKKIIKFDLFNYNPQALKYKTMSKKELEKVIQRKYNNIVSRDASHGDELHMMEHGKDKKINSTMHRTLYGPNKAFMAEETGGVDFILKDAMEVDRLYQMQMGTAIQMKRVFGDKMGFFKRLELIEDIADRMKVDPPKLNIENIFPFVRDIKKAVTGKISIDEVNAISRNFEDQVYNLYGLHNRIPADTLSKRLIENLMNFTVTTTMGNAGLSGMAEMARRTTVHGLGKAGLFPGGKGHIEALSGTYGQSLKVLNEELREQIKKQASEMYTHMEIISSQGYLSRLVNTDMGAINRNVGTNIVSKFINKAEQINRGAARATYLANGQTHLTYFLKDSYAMQSAHYFLKDLLDLHKGKLNIKGIERLKQYGLGKKHAKIINDLNDKGIIEKVSKPGRDDLFLHNMDRWGEVKGGDDIFSSFMNAMKQDVERAIVTPGYSSKPNMMYGRIQIDNQKVADFLGNSNFLKNLNKYSGGLTGEFHALGRGGAYENALLLPILQFYSFSLGASRYILRNLPTESGPFWGIMAAMAYTHFANHMKYGWYGDLDWKQKMFMSYEVSGIGGYLSDLPRVIETESNGKYGLRRLLDIDELEFMQDRDRRGSSLIGIGPQKLREIFEARDDLERSNQFSRNMPFQNNMILKRGWQVLGDMPGNPYSPIGDWIFDVDRDKIKKRNRNRRKKDRFGREK